MFLWENNIVIYYVFQITQTIHRTINFSFTITIIIIIVSIFDLYYCNCYFCLCKIWNMMKSDVVLHAMIFWYLLLLEGLGFNK